MMITDDLFSQTMVKLLVENYTGNIAFLVLLL